MNPSNNNMHNHNQRQAASIIHSQQRKQTTDENFRRKKNKSQNIQSKPDLPKTNTNGLNDKGLLLHLKKKKINT